LKLSGEAEYARETFASWRNWQIPHVRWIWVSVYLVAGVIALVLGAGAATALIGALVAIPVVGGLELWLRRRHAERPGNA
jgi:hypothetical protein